MICVCFHRKKCKTSAKISFPSTLSLSRRYELAPPPCMSIKISLTVESVYLHHVVRGKECDGNWAIKRNLRKNIFCINHRANQKGLMCKKLACFRRSNKRTDPTWAFIVLVKWTISLALSSDNYFQLWHGSSWLTPVICIHAIYEALQSDAKRDPNSTPWSTMRKTSKFRNHIHKNALKRKNCAYNVVLAVLWQWQHENSAHRRFLSF